MIFPAAPGGYGVTERTVCYWNLVHGASKILTAKQLNLSEDTVQSYFRLGRLICGQDALHRQQKIVFGRRGDETTDIEIDEHSWHGWQVGNMHYFYVWIGIQQRGDLSKLWLMPLRGSDPDMPLGVVHSRDEARVPPLTDQCLQECLEAALSEEANVNAMTDSALAYQALKIGPHGIVAKFLVNHSADPPEFTRPIEVIANVATQETRPGYAGTQNIDGTWKHLEKHIPEQLSKARTEETRVMCAERIRFGQWMYMLGPSDKWVAFRQAAARYETIALEDKPGETIRAGKRKA